MEEKVEYILDKEWLVLIQEAKDLGLSLEEVKDFLEDKAEQK